MFPKTRQQIDNGIVKQIRDWANGNPHHAEGYYGHLVCVPDQSCCNNSGIIKSSKKLRKRFVKALDDDDWLIVPPMRDFAETARGPHFGRQDNTVSH